MFSYFYKQRKITIQYLSIKQNKSFPRYVSISEWSQTTCSHPCELTIILISRPPWWQEEVEDQAAGSSISKSRCLGVGWHELQLQSEWRHFWIISNSHDNVQSIEQLSLTPLCWQLDMEEGLDKEMSHLSTSTHTRGTRLNIAQRCLHIYDSRETAMCCCYVKESNWKAYVFPRASLS